MKMMPAKNSYYDAPSISNDAVMPRPREVLGQIICENNAKLGEILTLTGEITYKLLGSQDSETNIELQRECGYFGEIEDQSETLVMILNRLHRINANL